MVREANMKQAASEKQLKEAWGKVSPRPRLPRPVQSSCAPSYSVGPPCGPVGPPGMMG